MGDKFVDLTHHDGNTLSQPFYNEVLSAGNIRLTSSFIPKCINLKLSERIETWIKCGLINKAGEEAFKIKDLNTLEQLKEKATEPQLAEFERMIT
jgi:vacuolar protein sorting-associated protein 16